MNATAGQTLDGIEHAALPARPLHLAIGMFDGVHLGHRAVVESAVQSARRAGGVAGVLTFWPHPSAILAPPERRTKMMLGVDAKQRLLAGLGVDAVITQRFTPELAKLTAEEFLPWLRRSLPHLAAIYVGENWRFGAGRRGDVTMLVAEARKMGINVFSAHRVNFDGDPISSTRIRGLLEAGDIVTANELLGYSYFAEGTVASGKKLGRTIGFPTLNLPWSPECRPRLGVYAVTVSGPGAATPLPGVANYGLRPTVEQVTEPRLEVHVLAPCPFDAGSAIHVEWLRFVRPEMKFAGIDQLRAQITQDVAAVQTELKS